MEDEIVESDGDDWRSSMAGLLAFWFGSYRVALESLAWYVVSVFAAAKRSPKGKRVRKVNIPTGRRRTDGWEFNGA